MQVHEVEQKPAGGFFQLSTRRHFIFSQLDTKTDIALKCEVRQKIDNSLFQQSIRPDTNEMKQPYHVIGF